jgi:hypothetical protein
MPYTIRSGNTEIQIVEFRDTIDGTGKTALTANLGETTSTLIIAKLISSPTEESNCVPGEFDPVFNPTRCSVPDVCPISDDLIVEDCGIPVAPEPLTDCPDIDIPVGVGTPPLPGDPADGPPGEPGPPGCTPQVTASSVVLYVQSCSQQRVSITVLEYPPCNAHILVVYYLCRPYHSANDCCVYKCCGGTWEVLDGGSQCFINGQTTSTSTTNPSDPEILYPPPDGPCDSEGITAVVCPCNPPTTPSDCQGSSCECGPWEKEGGTSNMLWPSSWCPSPCTYGDVVHSTVAGGDCWTAAGSGSGCGSSLLQVCCVGGQIEMTLTCKDGSQVVYPDVIDEEDHCVFMGFFDPDNFGECCDGQSTTAVIIGTITLQKCSTTTTNTNTTTSSTTTSSTSTSTSSSTTTDPPPGSTTTSSSTTTTECPEEEQEFACRWRWNGSAWDFVENTSSCPGCECVTVPDYTPIHINEESFTDCEFS